MAEHCPAFPCKVYHGTPCRVIYITEPQKTQCRFHGHAGTDAGMNSAKKMVQGFIPEFSCRAIASMMIKNGKPTVNVRKIITYDWVLFPSHREAGQNTSAPTKFVSKVANVVTESVNDLVEASKDIMIPLKEILEKTLVNKITHTYKDII